MNRLFNPGNPEPTDRVNDQLYELAEKLLSTVFNNTWEGRTDVEKTPKRYACYDFELPRAP